MRMTRGWGFPAIVQLIGLSAAVVGAGASIGLSGTTVQAASLVDAVQLAITTNPTIGIVASNRQQIDEELRQARGFYLPQVDVLFGIGKESTNNLTTRGRRKDLMTLTREEATLTIRQSLFDGFEREGRIGREKARIRSAARRVFENSEFLALDAIGAYLDVVRQRELFALSEQNVEIHLGRLAQIQQRVSAGAGSTADVSQTEARVSRARATLAQTANELRDAEALYNRIVGQFPDELARPNVDASALPPSLDDALDLTRRGNPTVKIFEADVDAAEKEVTMAEAAFYPSLTIEAESNYTENANGIETYDWESRLMLRLRWNLFRGGIDRANRQEALMVVAENRNRRATASIEANEEVRRTWAALESSRIRAVNLGEAARHNVNTRDAYVQQFDVAQRTLLDVLDAENELFVSRGQAISAEINVMRASYRVLAVTGQLLAMLGVVAPEQSNEQSETFVQSLMRP